MKLVGLVLALALCGAALGLFPDDLTPGDYSAFEPETGGVNVDTVAKVVTNGPGGGFCVGGYAEAVSSEYSLPGTLDPLSLGQGGRSAWIANFGQDGQQKWMVHFGSSRDDEVLGLAVSGGFLYVTGYTSDAIVKAARKGLKDIFVMRFDVESGERDELYSVMLGTSKDDIGNALVSAPTGEVYIAGTTGGSLYEQISSASGTDVFVARLGGLSGTTKYAKQHGYGSSLTAVDLKMFEERLYLLSEGTMDDDSVRMVAMVFSVGASSITRDLVIPVSGTENYYPKRIQFSKTARALQLVGNVQVGANDLDIVVVKLDVDQLDDADRRWIHFLGSPRDDFVVDSAVLSNDNVVLLGYTRGALNESVPSKGRYVPFVAVLNATGADLLKAQKPAESFTVWEEPVAMILTQSFEILYTARKRDSRGYSELQLGAIALPPSVTAGAADPSVVIPVAVATAAPKPEQPAESNVPAVNNTPAVIEPTTAPSQPSTSGPLPLPTAPTLPDPIPETVQGQGGIVSGQSADDNDAAQGGSPNLLVYVGAAVGGISVIAGVAVIGAFLLRRHRAKAAGKSDSLELDHPWVPEAFLRRRSSSGRGQATGP